MNRSVRRHRSCYRCLLAVRSSFLPRYGRLQHRLPAADVVTSYTRIAKRFTHDDKSSSSSARGEGDSDRITIGRHSPDSKTQPSLHAVKHQVKHRAQETIGVKVTARIIEIVAEAVERGVSKAAASKTIAAAGKQGAKAIVKQAAVRTAERTPPSAKFFLRIFPTSLAVKRFGRGVLIAVPIVGAVFSAWLARSDIRRVYQELEIARSDYERALAREAKRDVHPTTIGRPGSDNPPSAGNELNLTISIDMSTVRCFGVAAAADSANTVAHLVTAYGLYQGWAPDPLFVVESLSIGAAVLSTGGAVGGEYLSARREAVVELKKAEAEKISFDNEEVRRKGDGQDHGQR